MALEKFSRNHWTHWQLHLDLWQLHLAWGKLLWLFAYSLSFAFAFACAFLAISLTLCTCLLSLLNNYLIATQKKVAVPGKKHYQAKLSCFLSEAFLFV
jgi:hypothetical protein